MVYWLLKSILVGPLVRLLWRPRVEGLHHVPATGGAIFASNHLSFSDSIFLPLVVPRRITFPAKMEYFTGTGLKGWATKMFFTVTGQIPIDRSGGEASMTALRQGLKVLRRGEFFGIYPEGTRSPDGRLYKGKTGVARMALEAGVPVIPVAMIDTDKAQPTGQKIPNLHPVGVRIGRPLDFSRYEGMEEDRYVLRSITDEIMYELADLSGKPYVDEYAATIKDRLSARARATVDQARAGVRDTTQQVAAGLSQRFTRDEDGQDHPVTGDVTDEETSPGPDEASFEVPAWDQVGTQDHPPGSMQVRPPDQPEVRPTGTE